MILGIAFSVLFVTFTNYRFYNASIDDSKELANALMSDSNTKVVTNIVIEDTEVTWRENNYEKISLNKLIREKETLLKDKPNFKIKEL